jgi:hypothetical protein
VSRTEASSAGRVGRPFRAFQAAVFATESHCWLCGGYVDQRLHPRHRLARSVDHLVQLQHHGPPHDRANGRLAHIGCNSGRSNALRNLPIEDCACSLGYPCARLNPAQPRGYVELDPSEV